MRKILPVVLFFLSSLNAYAALGGSSDPRIAGLVKQGVHFTDADYAACKLEPSATNNNWYIDAANGNDSYDGQAPAYDGAHGPKKTIASVLDQNNPPGKGAYIIIKAGKYKMGPVWLYGPPYWDENDADNMLTIGPYGDGEVILDWSFDLTGKIWEQEDPNIYKIKTNIPIHGIVMDNDFRSFHEVTSKAKPGISGLLKYGDWFYDATTTYFYVYTGGINPADHNTILLDNAGPEDENWSLYCRNNPFYIKFYGLTLIASHASPWISSPHSTFELCKIMYNNRSGISFLDGGEYETVTRCFFYGNVMDNWPRGHRSKNEADGLWEPCIAGCPNLRFSGNIVMDSGGEGIRSQDNSVIEDNIFCDNFSANIYAGDAPHQTIRRNIILATRQDMNDLWGYPEYFGESWQKILRKTRGAGITISAEDPKGRYAGDKIYNNIIIDCRYGISSVEGSGEFGIKNTAFYNNLIVVPNADGAPYEDTYFGVLFSAFEGRNSNSFFKNNIIISQHAKNYLIGTQKGDNIAYDNNIYFAPEKDKPFMGYYESWNYSFAEWKKSFRRDAKSFNENPNLNKIDWASAADLIVSDCEPQSTSLALDAGADLGTDYATDYDSAPRPYGAAWDIGPFEYGSSAPGSDKTPPTVPQGLTSSNITQASATLSWSASTDNVGIKGYKIYRNGTQVGASVSTMYSDATLAADTSYTYTVAAVDDADNKSALSNSFTITTLPVVYVLSTVAVNGVIIKSANETNFAAGSVVRLKAVPSSGYQFSNWSGGLSGSTNPAPLTMNADKTVIAEFSATAKK